MDFTFQCGGGEVGKNFLVCSAPANPAYTEVTANSGGFCCGCYRCIENYISRNFFDIAPKHFPLKI